MKLKFFTSRSFFSKLMLSHLIIIFISLTVIGIIFSYLVQNYYFGLKEWEATNNSRRIAELVSENISEGNIRSKNIEDTSGKINTIARSSNMDIGLMNAQGRMILNAPTIKDFSLTLEKTEIENVLQGNTITKKIMGPEHKNLLMVIPIIETENNDIIIMNHQPVKENIQAVGAIIIQTPLGSMTATVNNIFRLVLYSFLIAIIAAIFLSISFARRVTKPLEAIKHSALKGAKGNFQVVDLPENSSNEIKHLVSTFNYSVKQINESLERKKQLEKMRKKFVANVSHEFRAPLTSIKGFLEIMKDQDLSKNDISQYTDIMYKDAIYLENLLTDLLELGKLESKKMVLEKKDADPEDLVKRAINSMKNKINDKKNIIKVDIDKNLGKLHLDVNRIHQVLINLLENAVRYSPENSTIKITVSPLTDEISSKTIFSISDQGTGIAKNELENIWQRFYKVDSARTREQKMGSGLGLAIVKEIVSKHGGDVKAESIPGKGSTFSFII